MQKDRVFKEDLERLASSSVMDRFYHSTVLITGITGLIGSQLAKAFLTCSRLNSAGIRIIGIARNKEKAEQIFGKMLNDSWLSIIFQDITSTLDVAEDIDYIVHTASATGSKFFVDHPVETLSISIAGSTNMLELARRKKVKAMVYLSSMEAYGIADPALDEVTEKDLGYIDILNVRSSYSEGKRICECLCAAYSHEYGVNVVIARLAQTFGAGISFEENRVFAQFAKCVIRKEDIVLHTEGRSYGNYCYTSDAVKAILTLLQDGDKGEAYNVSNEATNISIRGMAEMVANEIAGGDIKVIYDIPESAMVYGYAPDVKMKLSADKLRKLGWEPEYNLKESYERLIGSMRERM